ncbi:MAG: hypothetical protein K6A30_01190, partial [Lachnospiraceae bacterium]|nr:hypothetical protein [Lachnospiraceae bacterium]
RSSMLTNCICSRFLSVLEVIIKAITIPNFDTSILPEKVAQSQINTGFVVLLQRKIHGVMPWTLSTV